MNTNANDCFAAVAVIIHGLIRHRSDEMLETFFELIKHKAEDKCDPLVLPRKWKYSRRLNDGEDWHTFGSVHELYREQYFEVMDC